MGMKSREKRELGADRQALGREEAEEELASPGGAWPQADVGEQNPRRGSGGSSSSKC